MFPLKNFKLILEYDGTHFHGWQIQSQGERTVQGEVQSVLFQVFKKKVIGIASGRTDAGVHALGQVVNFKVRTRMTPDAVRKAMTCYLPSDIVIKNVSEVGLKFHAQHSALSKTYRYTILNRECPSALERNYSHFYPYQLNLKRMRQEAASLLGKKDFKSFEAADQKRGKHSTVRHVTAIKIIKKKDWVYMDITADGFLYKMVRNIVGTLLDAGTERLHKGALEVILDQKNRGMAGDTAQAQGLCLMEVKY